MDREKDTLTIIVPLYNSAEYMRKCIDSIVSQTVLPDELMLIDDGSTDQSGEICDEYAAKYDFISVYHREHKGLVDGRKFGSANAKGEYILFIDSDDWALDGYVEDAKRLIQSNHPDILSYAFTILFGNGGSGYRSDGPSEGFYNRDGLQEQLLDIVNNRPFFTPLITPPIASKVFRRELFQEYVNRVPEGIDKGEDAAVTFPMSLACDSIYISKKSFYQSQIRNSSMSWEENPEEYSRLIKLVKHLRQSIDEKYADSINFEYLRIYTWHYVLDIMASIPDDWIEGRKELPCWDDVHSGDSVIIYGKGLFAANLIRLINKSGFCRIVGNVDSADAAEKLPELLQKKFDKIVIAIADSKISETIREYLHGFGVSDIKISSINTGSLSAAGFPDEIYELIKR